MFSEQEHLPPTTAPPAPHVKIPRGSFLPAAYIIMWAPKAAPCDILTGNEPANIGLYYEKVM